MRTDINTIQEKMDQLLETMLAFAQRERGAKRKKPGKKGMMARQVRIPKTKATSPPRRDWFRYQ